MVHRGFSQGCHRCRAHHTRCDKRRPGCKRCSLAGSPCPGYRDDGEGFLFRDQTRKVQRKIHNPKNQHEEHLFFPTHIPLNPETFATDFFFGNFMRLGTSRSLECGLYPTLFPLYHHSPLTSPLRLAVLVAAGEITALSHPSLHTPRHVRNVSTAIRAITLALQDPEQCGRDDLLLAILILQKAEQAYCVRHGGAISTVHEKGAVGLIRWRRNRVPGYLVAGARSSVLTSLVYGGAQSDVAAETLAYLSEVESREGMASAVSLDQLLARALCLWQRAAGTDAEQALGLQCELYELEDSLNLWLYRSSPSLLSTPSACVDPWLTTHAESYVTPEAALMFQQWRLTRSVTLTVSYILSKDEQTRIAIVDLLGNMLTATNFFFDLLRKKSGPLSLDPVPMGATCLHLTLRFLYWCLERLDVTAGHLLERVRERDRELREFLGVGDRDFMTSERVGRPA